MLVKKERKKKIIIITHIKLLRTLRQRSFLYLYFIYRLHRDKIIMDRFAIFENSCTYQVEMCDEAGLPVDFVSRDLGYSTQPLF